MSPQHLSTPHERFRLARLHLQDSGFCAACIQGKLWGRDATSATFGKLLSGQCPPALTEVSGIQEYQDQNEPQAPLHPLCLPCPAHLCNEAARVPGPFRASELGREHGWDYYNRALLCLAQWLVVLTLLLPAASVEPKVLVRSLAAFQVKSQPPLPAAQGGERAPVQLHPRPNKGPQRAKSSTLYGYALKMYHLHHFLVYSSFSPPFKFSPEGIFSLNF